ncbi:MAG: helix-hairpin-helix domain-containing protein [Bacteroidota bacterium]
MATKRTPQSNLIQQADRLKAQVMKLHDEALHTSDAMVDQTIATGAEWQKLMGKVLKSGTNLLEKQQDLFFYTLETLQGQYQGGSKRMRKLLSLNWRQPKELKTRVNKTRKPINTVVAEASTPKRTTRKTAGRRKAKAQSDQVQNDLTIIEGIGPKIAEYLGNAGIVTFAQLAQADIASLRAVLSTAGPRYKMHDPTTWRQQAKLAANGKWDQLKQKQAKLKGGRKAKK